MSLPMPLGTVVHEQELEFFPQITQLHRIYWGLKQIRFPHCLPFALSCTTVPGQAWSELGASPHRHTCTQS